jgi:hypothetical protein
MQVARRNSPAAARYKKRDFMAASIYDKVENLK